MLEKVEAYGIKLDKDHAKVQELIDTLKERESEGYQFEGSRRLLRVAHAESDGDS